MIGNFVGNVRQIIVGNPQMGNGFGVHTWPLPEIGAAQWPPEPPSLPLRSKPVFNHFKAVGLEVGQNRPSPPHGVTIAMVPELDSLWKRSRTHQPPCMGSAIGPTHPL